MLRRTRAAVAQQLPPCTTEIVRIPPTGEQLELHDANMRVVAQIVRKPYLSEMDLLRLRKALLMCRMAADSTFLVDKQRPAYSSKLREQLAAAAVTDPVGRPVLTLTLPDASALDGLAQSLGSLLALTPGAAGLLN